MIRVLQVPAFSIKGIVVDEAGTAVANAAVMLAADPSVGAIVNGPSRTRTAAGGPQFMTETMNGVTTAYRFDAEAVAVENQNDHMNGVRITVKRR